MKNKWDRRDRKRRKKRYGMKVGSRSVFTIQRRLIKKAKKNKDKKKDA